MVIIVLQGEDGVFYPAAWKSGFVKLPPNPMDHRQHDQSEGERNADME
jgi:hypothetical protein